MSQKLSSPRPEVRVRMLVLTRKTNQSIMIGDEIEVSILSVSGEKVRIGIDAPREVAVFRKEVYEAIDKGAAPASGGDSDDSVDDELKRLK